MNWKSHRAKLMFLEMGIVFGANLLISVLSYIFYIDGTGISLDLPGPEI